MSQKFTILVGKPKVFPYAKMSKIYEKIMSTNFLSQNCIPQKMIICDVNNDELYVDVGRQLRLKYLLLGEKKYIQTKILNKDNTIEQNLNRFTNHINEIYKLSVYKQSIRKIKVNNYEMYVLYFVISYILSYYLFWKYYKLAWEYIKQYPKVSTVVISIVVFKKLFWFVTFSFLIFKKQTFIYCLKAV